MNDRRTPAQRRRPLWFAIPIVLVLIGGVWGGRRACRAERAAPSTRQSPQVRPSVAWREPSPSQQGEYPRWGPFGAQPGASATVVAGRVLFDGTPVADATVELWSPLADALAVPFTRTQTSADGRFDFGLQPAATFVAVASAPGYLRSLAEIDARSPLRCLGSMPCESIELSLARCDATVFGRVLDAWGAAIEGAEVRSTSSRAGPAVVADEEGNYSLCVLPFGYDSRFDAWVRVDAGGFASRLVPVSAQGRSRLDIVLRPGGTITGLVTRGNGRPVTGALVRTTTGVAVSAVTNGDGRFELVGLAPGRHELKAEAEHLRGAAEVFVDEAGLLGETVIEMTPLATLAGVVEGDDGPIANEGVALYQGIRRVASAKSQSDGSFVLSNVTPGDARFVVGDYRVVSPTKLRIDQAEVSGVTVRVESRPLGIVRGRVTRAGAPRSGVAVAFSPAEGRTRRFTSLPDGTFEARLDPDTYTVSARTAEGRSPPLTVTVEDGKTTEGVEVELSIDSSVSGVVVDERGDAVAGAEVVLTQPGADDRWLAATDVNGEFRVGALTAGVAYELQIADATGVLALAEDSRGSVSTPADGTPVDGLRLVVQRDRLTISGLVVDANGAPVEDVDVMATVVASSAANEAVSEWALLSSGPVPQLGPGSRTREDGRFTITGLSDDVYELRARAWSGGRASLERVRAGASGVRLELIAAGALEGTLVGFPEQVDVALAARHGESPLFRRRGVVHGATFEIPGLAPGDYEVIVSTRDQVMRRAVVIEAGETTTVEMVRPDQRGELRGSAIDVDSGAPLGGARCALLPHDGAPFPQHLSSALHAASDAQGVFRIRDIPVGELEVVCTRGEPQAAGYALVTISAGANEVTVPAVGSGTSSPNARSVGLAVDVSAFPRVVSLVMADSPAAEAGVAVGDVVATIDGFAADRLPARGIFTLLYGRAPGTTVRLQLVRAGADRAVTLTVGGS